jgi:hypothetical protein
MNEKTKCSPLKDLAGMNDLALKKHRLLLDLVALEAELSRVIMLNAEPPPIPESPTVSQGLEAAHQLVQGLIAKLQNKIAP